MLKQLARFRVHLIFGGLLGAWLAMLTIAGLVEGDNLFHAFWMSIKETKLAEWVTVMGVWFAMAILVKQNDELRAKLNLQAGHQ